MADPELEAIRKKRLADLAGRRGLNSEGPTSGLPASVMSKLNGGRPEMSEDADKLAEQEEIRRTAVSQIVDSEARERLSRIALVRPQRAREIEDMLIRMAQTGQLRGRVTEEQLIGVLDQIEAAQAGPTPSKASSNKITYVRKNAFDDDLDF